MADSGTDPLIGQVLQGRWRVVERLGGGGMGAVYLAEQLSMGGRLVALKVLHPEYSRDDDFVRRFRAEAQQAGRINDPHVVTVYDFGQTDDGQLFLVMEYVVGPTLKAVLREGPLSLGRAVRFGLQLAEALQVVHRAGIVHRDVKGDNVIVREGRDQIKLMDFGIAKPTESEGRTWETRTGVIVGTPRYMAPEQIEKGEVSPLSDIYSWGIVLYELLTGDTPFMAQTPAAVMIKHVSEKPRPVRELRKEIPAGLERIVSWALEKRPEDRPQSMAAVILALERLTDVAQPEQRAEGTAATTVEIDQSRRSASRSRAWVRWSALAAGLGLAGSAAFWLVSREGEPMPQPAKPIPEVRTEPDPRLREHLELGSFFADRGEYDDAVKEYEAALAIDSANRDASEGLKRVRSASEAERQVLGD